MNQNNMAKIPEINEIWYAARPVWEKLPVGIMNSTEKQEATQGGEKRWEPRLGFVLSDSYMHYIYERVVLLPLTDIDRKYCGKPTEKKKCPPFGIALTRQYGKIRPGFILCGEMAGFDASPDKRGEPGCLQDTKEKGRLPPEENFIGQADSQIEEILTQEPDANAKFMGLRQGAVVRVNFSKSAECVVISNTTAIQTQRWYNRSAKEWHTSVVVLRAYQKEDGDSEEDKSVFVLAKNRFSFLDRDMTVDLCSVRTIDAEKRIDKNTTDEFEVLGYLPPGVTQEIVDKFVDFVGLQYCW